MIDEMRTPEQRMDAALDKAGHLLESGAAGLSAPEADEAWNNLNRLRESLADKNLRYKSAMLLIFTKNMIESLEVTAAKEGDGNLGRAAAMFKKIFMPLGRAIFGKDVLELENSGEARKYFTENNMNFDPDSPEGGRFVEHIRLKLREVTDGKA